MNSPNFVLTKELERGVPIRPLTPESTENLLLQTSSKKKLKELVGKTLISPRAKSDQSLSNYQIQSLNYNFRWQIARINALLNTILINNVVTKNDALQLKDCREKLVDLQKILNELQKTHRLNPKQAAEALRLIQQSFDTIEDTRLLISKLKDYNEEGEDFDASCDALIDQSYEPKSGDPFLSISALSDAVLSLSEMCRITQPSLAEKEKTSSAKLLNLFSADTRHLSWIIEDWSESIERACKTILKDLSQLDNTEEMIQQYDALNRHLREMQKEIKQIKKELQRMRTADFPKNIKNDLELIFSSLENAQNHLHLTAIKAQEKLQKLQNSSHFSESHRIDYGDTTWNKISLKHASRQPPSWLMKKIEDVTNVQEWSDSTKDIVFRLFTLMQLDPVSKVAEAYDLLSGKQTANLKKMADILKEKAFREIPPETIKDIEYATATLGTLLMFNYQSIQHPKSLEQLTHKCPSIRPSLQKALDQFGSTPPTQEQVRSLVDDFRVERLLQESSLSAPYFNRIVYGSAVQKKEEAPSTETSFEKNDAALVQKPEDEKAVSSSSSHLGVIPKAIETLRSFPQTVNWSAYVQDPPISQEIFESHIQQQTYHNLTMAIDRVSSIEKQLKSLKEYDYNPIREEVALVHRELLKAVANTPLSNCPLTTLATWTQHASDQCFAVEVLEKQITAIEKKLTSKKKQIELLGTNPTLYTSEYNMIKLLSHAWELRGYAYPMEKNSKNWLELFIQDPIKFIDEHIELEGYEPNKPLRYMEYTLHSFASSFPESLSEAERSTIITAIVPSIDLEEGEISPTNIAIIMSKLQKSRTVLIPTGWTGHATSIVIHENYLMFCNRGEGTQFPIQTYKINPAKITKEIIKEFAWETRADFVKKFPQTLSKLDAVQDSICLNLQKLNPLRPLQTVGNCAWESPETAIFALIVLPRLLAQGIEADLFNQHETIEKAYLDFQGWLQFTKINILESYVGHNERGTSRSYEENPDLLKAIFRQDLEEKKINPSGKKCNALLDQLSRQMIPQTYDDFLIEREKIFDKFAWKQKVEEKFQSIKDHEYQQFPSLLENHFELIPFLRDEIIPRRQEIGAYIALPIISFLVSSLFYYTFQRIKRIINK